jgi:hypothetical protein
MCGRNSTSAGCKASTKTEILYKEQRGTNKQEEVKEMLKDSDDSLYSELLSLCTFCIA